MNSLGDFVVIAVEDGTVQLVNIDDPTSIREFTPYGTNQPRYVRVSSDGRFVAVLFHSQQVWLYDVINSVDLSSELRRQKNISGIGFSESAESATFMSVDRIDRVTEYELPTLRVISTKASSGTFMQRISWYALDPLTKICPQPSGLGSTVDYVISGKTSANIGDGSSLNQAQIKFDPWGPVWSSAAFMLVVLFVSCVYIHRQDY